MWLTLFQTSCRRWTWCAYMSGSTLIPVASLLRGAAPVSPALDGAAAEVRSVGMNTLLSMLISSMVEDTAVRKGRRREGGSGVGR